MNKLFKVLLVLNILILCGIVIMILIGIFNSYHSGINKNWFFSGSWIQSQEELAYGVDAIKIYLSQIFLYFVVFSILGIFPILNLPIIFFIIEKMKLYKKMESSKTLIFSIIICVLAHIISFYFGFSLVTIVLPYIECIQISYMILYISITKGGKENDRN